MQQTETYKLNLIETSDAFSPNPLNENMEKVEAALATKANAAENEAAHAALDQRITVLELRRVVAGTYTGDGASYQFIDLGFTPIAVLINPPDYSHSRDILCVVGSPTEVMEILPGGFNVQRRNENNFYSNMKGAKYEYIAFC